ncbi:hypothetical protein EYZ11_010372 [Aspergillus tanneri]|uniref:Uncharacterized protein n=1 Tax=Aspergillus tanneri TaxID=1220188 RepID=A0A4S3J625_9EURO|nr:hypothetical protein EYZ11_010372 [Aspergillus tanneri]
MPIANKFLAVTQSHRGETATPYCNVTVPRFLRKDVTLASGIVWYRMGTA